MVHLTICSSLGNTPNVSCSERIYTSSANVNRHIKNDHDREGLPAQTRKSLGKQPRKKTPQ